MANFKVNSVPSWIQITATGGQDEFSVPFPFIAQSDLSVWQDGVKLTITTEYTVTGENTASGGLVTLVTPASLNDVITIQDTMAVDRQEIYQSVVSALTGSQLNNDANREVLMIRDTQTTVDYLMLQYAPYADISQDITVTTDRLIPILPAGATWRKNAGDTAIESFVLPDIPVGIQADFTADNRITTTDLGAGPEYIQQTDIQIIASTITAVLNDLTLTGSNNVLVSTPGYINLSPGGTLILDGIVWPTNAASSLDVLRLKSGSTTLTEWAPGLTVTMPVTADDIPIFDGTTGVIKDSSYSFVSIQNSQLLYGVDTGVADAMTVTLAPAITAYAAGQMFNIRANAANTGAVTIDINGLGAKDITKLYNEPLVVGDVLEDQVITIVYDGTQFQMTNPAANDTPGGVINAGLANQLAYYAASGTTLSGLATANDGVLVTGATGIPSISSTLPSGISATNMNLTTPSLGVASATSINKVAITAPATGSTLTIADGKTLTQDNTLTYTGIDGSSVNFGAGGTVLYSGYTPVAWVTIAGTTQAATVATAYVVGNAAQTTITLPATFAVGDQVIIEGFGAGGFIVAANAGDTIVTASGTTSAGGTLTCALAAGNAYFVGLVANTTWKLVSTNTSLAIA